MLIAHSSLQVELQAAFVVQRWGPVHREDRLPDAQRVLHTGNVELRASVLDFAPRFRIRHLVKAPRTPPPFGLQHIGLQDVPLLLLVTVPDYGHALGLRGQALAEAQVVHEVLVKVLVGGQQLLVVLQALQVRGIQQAGGAVQLLQATVEVVEDLVHQLNEELDRLVEGVAQNERRLLVQVQLGALATEGQDIGSQGVDGPALALIGAHDHLSKNIDKLTSIKLHI